MPPGHTCCDDCLLKHTQNLPKCSLCGRTLRDSCEGCRHCDGAAKNANKSLYFVVTAAGSWQLHTHYNRTGTSFLCGFFIPLLRLTLFGERSRIFYQCSKWLVSDSVHVDGRRNKEGEPRRTDYAKESRSSGSDWLSICWLGKGKKKKGIRREGRRKEEEAGRKERKKSWRKMGKRSPHLPANWSGLSEQAVEGGCGTSHYSFVVEALWWGSPSEEK